MRPEDRTRVLHMIEAAEAIAEFVSGRNRIDLDSDRLLFFALVRAVEVFGEAAAKVSSEARTVTASRTILWKTATEEIPALLPALRGLIEE
jgi:uncharacterized protein with HEPN domain